MKGIVNKIFIVFLFFLILGGKGLAQGDFEDLNTGYPVPKYIKRGLVLYYSSSGYTVNKGKKDYVSFDQITIITGIDGQKVIGMVYNISSQGMITQESKVIGIGGAGGFYLHPAYIKEMQGKEEQGYEFIGNGAIRYRTDKEEGEISYDPKSGLFLTMKIKSRTSEAVSIYKGYEYIDLPPLPNSFPYVTKNKYIYLIYGPTYGMNMALGSIHISPISFGKKTAVFNLLTRGGMMGVDTETKSYGTTLMGPHYINLKSIGNKKDIISLKQRDLRVYIEGEDEYGTLVHLVVNGVEYFTTCIDPESGLAIYQNQYIPGIGTMKFVLRQ